jgi:hypothetical protein
MRFKNKVTMRNHISHDTPKPADTMRFPKKN